MKAKTLPDPFTVLDFSDPTTGACLGHVCIATDDFLQAVKITHRLGINPGGQVAGRAVPADIVPDHYFDRLLTCQQYRALIGGAEDAAPEDSALEDAALDKAESVFKPMFEQLVCTIKQHHAAGADCRALVYWTFGALLPLLFYDDWQPDELKSQIDEIYAQHRPERRA